MSPGGNIEWVQDPDLSMSTQLPPRPWGKPDIRKVPPCASPSFPLDISLLLLISCTLTSSGQTSLQMAMAPHHHSDSQSGCQSDILMGVSVPKCELHTEGAAS